MNIASFFATNFSSLSMSATIIFDLKTIIFLFAMTCSAVMLIRILEGRTVDIFSIRPCHKGISIGLTR